MTEALRAATGNEVAGAVKGDGGTAMSRAQADTGARR